MENAARFVFLPDGAHASVNTLAAMIADNLDSLLRVWRFSAPEPGDITPYTYAAAFRQGLDDCVCVVVRSRVSVQPEQPRARVPYRALVEFLRQKQITISEQTLGSDRIPDEAGIRPFLVREIMAAMSDHWDKRYRTIFAGIETKVLAM